MQATDSQPTTADFDPLAHEESILWRESPLGFAFVREATVDRTTRRRPIGWHDLGRVLGYSLLSPDAPSDPQCKRFVRRVWWLKKWDQDLMAEGVTYPIEAVMPTSIAVGQASRRAMTARQREAAAG